VSTVFQAQEPIQSFGFADRDEANRESPAREPTIIVRTTRTIVALSLDHEIIRTFSIPGDSQGAGLVAWYELADGSALAEFYEPWRTESEANIAPRMLFQVAPDGTIRNQSELKLQSGMLIWSKQREAMLLSWEFPVPALLPFVELFFELLINQRQTFAVAERATLLSAWQPLLAVTCLGLVLAIAAWRRARAFGLPGRDQAVWAIFVLLLGIPGFAGFMLHRRWPVRAECPRCHAQAPRDRHLCAACAAEFPGPAVRGIEVFA
jgi:hypothetical protein